MKKFIFPLMLALITLLSACKQGNNNNSSAPQGPGNFNPEEMVNRQLEELNKILVFIDDQEEKMREVLSAGMKNMMDMREEMRNGDGDRESMREAMMQAREEQNAKVKEILSDEQWEKYQAFEAERRSRRGQGGGPGGRPQ
ncbi:hypothetical protein [uncultured Draconibacterium sp.]|uniref:hypothetical protein n=1 Tax=uncultured Draconibacterium sp. TaxID=1573823 RepID=UPI0025E9B1E6|nr:hypothetical protein [uncultured Draconibacterium sp.]